MSPVVATETTEMCKSFKEVFQIANSPSVQFLTPNTFTERSFVTNTTFVFATCKLATCMFSPPIMIKVALKCTWMNRFKYFI